MGKNKYIETPLKLLELFEHYVKHTKSNPRVENVLYQKTGEIIAIPRETPLSWIGFENWLFKNDIITELKSYEQNENKSYTEYLPIITRIKGFIYQDKVEGASVGIFNASIIARELGLKEQTDITSGGEKVQTTIVWGGNEIKV